MDRVKSSSCDCPEKISVDVDSNSSCCTSFSFSSSSHEVAEIFPIVNFPPSVLSHDTKTSKVSEKDNPHEFYAKNLNHVFLPKPDFEGCKNNHQNYV
jgi:hypothetical protein